jgi:hypothetical protein
MFGDDEEDGETNRDEDKYYPYVYLDVPVSFF